MLADPSKTATKGTCEEHRSKTSATRTRFTAFNNTVEAVYYKVLTDRTTQTERHADVQEEDPKCFVHGWSHEIGIAEKFSLYQARYLDMLSKFRHMQDGRLDLVE